MKRYCFEIRFLKDVEFKAIVIDRFNYKILYDNLLFEPIFKRVLQGRYKCTYLAGYIKYKLPKFRIFQIKSKNAIANLKRYSQNFKLSNSFNCKLYQIK